MGRHAAARRAQRLEEGRPRGASIEDVPPGGLNLSVGSLADEITTRACGRWFIERLKAIPVERGTVPKPRAAAEGSAGNA